MKVKQQKIIYYTDELNNEFSTIQITPRKIDANYDYGKNNFKWKFLHWFWYTLTFRPIATLVLKLAVHHKIVNKQVLKPFKHRAYFMYANHTNAACDPFIPGMVAKPNHIYVIVHPNNVSMPVLGRINPYLGALPLPDDFAAARNFMETIKMRLEQNHSIMIYP